MYFKECFKSLLHTLYRLSALGPCGTPLPFSGSAFVHVNRRKYKTFLIVDIFKCSFGAVNFKTQGNAGSVAACFVKLYFFIHLQATLNKINLY